MRSGRDPFGVGSGGGSGAGGPAGSAAGLAQLPARADTETAMRQDRLRPGRAHRDLRAGCRQEAGTPSTSVHPMASYTSVPVPVISVLGCTAAVVLSPLRLILHRYAAHERWRNLTTRPVYRRASAAPGGCLRLA